MIDEFLQNICKANENVSDKVKSKELEKNLSNHSIEVLYKKIKTFNYDLLLYVETATGFKNEHFMQSFIEKAHKSDIEPSLKNKNNNLALNRLMD